MNISVGGIFVETEELHEVGTRVLVVTTLPTGEIQAPGVIGWVRRSNQSEAAGMGIAFEGLVSADGDAIKHFAGRTF
jgi:Tfp pilus assembly protein PilZ